jgi:hypothetical protein
MQIVNLRFFIEGIVLFNQTKSSDLRQYLRDAFSETPHAIPHYEKLFADVKSAQEACARQFPF